MTYKAAVQGVIGKEARNWVERVLDKQKIPHGYICYGKVKTEIEKGKYGNIFWDVYIEVTTDSILPEKIIAGGTMDEYAIYCSVIWNHDKSKILWMNVEETRKSLGIEEFKWE